MLSLTVSKVSKRKKAKDNSATKIWSDSIKWKKYLKFSNHNSHQSKTCRTEVSSKMRLVKRQAKGKEEESEEYETRRIRKYEHDKP